MAGCALKEGLGKQCEYNENVCGLLCEGPGAQAGKIGYCSAYRGTRHRLQFGPMRGSHGY
jgi:hypothetical protein